ncbi:MAG: metal-sulfur cluster assembly factor, partial [Nanoarchaeota archaeon]
MTEKEEKGFFQRIKEVFTGEEEEEPQNQEEILQNAAMAEGETQDEEELNRIAEAAVEKTKQGASSIVEGESEEKAATSKLGLQKVSASEMEADPEKKPMIDALKTVVDPELQVDIWTLGLIYNMEQKPEQKEINILMTFTSIMCPVGPMIVQNVDMALKKLPNVHKVNVEVT